MNKEEFKIRMIRSNDTNKSLSKLLGISETTLTRKINENRSQFYRTEIERLKKYWNLTNEEVDLIFFKSTVS